MPFVLFLLALGGLGALAVKAGQAKTEAERGHDPLGDRPATDPSVVQAALFSAVNIGLAAPNGADFTEQNCGVGCFEVSLGGNFVGLADLGQCVQIGRAYPTARFRRIG